MCKFFKLKQDSGRRKFCLRVLLEFITSFPTVYWELFSLNSVFMFSVLKVYFEDHLDDDQYAGQLFGLGANK